MDIPSAWLNTAEKIESMGYSAYITGAALRDIIMNRGIRSCFIETTAPKSLIEKLFRRVIDSGNGVVTAVNGNSVYNLRLLRSADDIGTSEEFTINSALYSPRTGLIDPHGSADDINARLIRCTRAPEEIFRRSPLSMLTAVRYAAVFGFDISPQIRRALIKYAVMIKRADPAGVYDELNKTIMSDHPEGFILLHETGLLAYIIPELETCFGVSQKNKYHIYNVGEHIVRAMCGAPRDPLLRWAALLHDIGKPECVSTDSSGVIHFYGHHRVGAAIASDILHRLNAENGFINDVILLVENHDVRVEPNNQSVKKMMSRCSAELFEKLLSLQEADNRAKNPKYLPEKLARINSAREICREIIKNGEPYTVSQLAVGSRDLIKLGYRAGREISDALRALLDEVIINPKLNTKDYLTKRAAELRRRRR